METIKINKQNTKMIAHRGLSGLEKENSMAAFICAGCHSYYGIECDIHPTKDNFFVVIHDSNTERVSGKNLIVEESTYDEIKDITLYGVNSSINYNHLRIPLLEEYIECCKKYNKICVIEFKFLFKEADIQKVINIIKSYDYLENCVFISFIIENLIVLKNINENFKIQYLTSTWDEEKINKCLEYKFDLDILYTELTKERIDFIHQNNLKVNVWTVNSKEAGEQLVNDGVDYITTNILE